MAYTYLITGATSDVGRALIERLLADAPADTTVLAQGCGDLEKLADLCARFPGQVRPCADPFHPSARPARGQCQVQGV